MNFKGLLETTKRRKYGMTKEWLDENPDYTCPCGISVHPSARNPKAIHIKGCPFSDPSYPPSRRTNLEFKSRKRKLGEDWEDDNEGDYVGTYAHDSKVSRNHPQNFKKAVKTYKNSSLIKAPNLDRDHPPKSDLAIHHFDKGQFIHKFKKDEVSEGVNMKFQELLDEVAKKKPEKKKPEKKEKPKSVKRRKKVQKDELAHEPGEWQGHDKSAKMSFEA
jgi:predicted RNA-binding protein with RPS1 domain